MKGAAEFGDAFLRDLKLEDGTPVVDCTMEEIGRGVRLYYHPSGGGHGFDFAVVEWCACGAEEDQWENPEVRNVVRGIALFDGIRHVWMGEKGEGYLNYPNARTIALAFARLRALELAHCSSPLEARDDEKPTPTSSISNPTGLQEREDG